MVPICVAPKKHLQDPDSPPPLFSLMGSKLDNGGGAVEGGNILSLSPILCLSLSFNAYLQDPDYLSLSWGHRTGGGGWEYFVSIFSSILSLSIFIPISSLFLNTVFPFLYLYFFFKHYIFLLSFAFAFPLSPLLYVAHEPTQIIIIIKLLKFVR